jgi:nicotinate phosphoribosyltransferase
MSDFQETMALHTDLYEFTMAAAYLDANFAANATFELFVRSLPRKRGFLVAAGLEQALHHLEKLKFTDTQIAYLRDQPVFRHTSTAFFDYLRNFRFTGDVWAMPEGTPVFAEEPILRVTAPIIEAQLVETLLLSTITFQTMIASKAARVVKAARGRAVVEFGSRRAHGPEAGVLAARAAYIGGCAGTSNVEAGQRYGVPIFGTLAHSFVMAYGDELEAFRRFHELFPAYDVLLVDTYDTLHAVDEIVRAGIKPTAIRLDSGNLGELSIQARKRLDQAGLKQTRIFASGDLDEYGIADLLEKGAQIDAFGVGTALATSSDAPALGGVYKLVDVEKDGNIFYRAKFSEEKVTYPGRKQVFRSRGKDGKLTGDIIACEGETFSKHEPLLQQVMRYGKMTNPAPSIDTIRRLADERTAAIPEMCFLEHECYNVRFSDKLQRLLSALRPKAGRSKKNREARVVSSRRK